MSRVARLSIEALDALHTADLKREWARCYGAPAPKLSADLLRLGLAYRLQEKRHGAMTRETKRVLRAAAKAASVDEVGSTSPPPPKLTVGTRLVRDWHGAGHTVTVLNKGFEYDGQQWRSLTAIAKAITGTHRNGPRFFGLT
ncbi:MAG: DUF2924 domain-containing protein [Pseudomonadota bacterium]